MSGCAMCDADPLQRPVPLDRLDNQSSDDQMELLSVIRAGPGTGLAANALVAGDTANAQKKLTIAAIFCVCFMLCEAIGGYAANSLAIMTDAAHLLADLAGFLISVFSLSLSAKPATEKMSFGWYRMEIIGALLSVILIWVVTGGLFVEAVTRIQNPSPVHGNIMLALAVVGLVVNIIIALVLHSTGHAHSIGSGHSHTSEQRQQHASLERPAHLEENVHKENTDTPPDTVEGRRSPRSSELETALLGQDKINKKQENINVRAAIIHAVGDMIQSIGVIIASSLICYNPAWSIIDPLSTFLFGIIVLLSTLGLLRECIHVLMEGAPTHISTILVRESLKGVAHVGQVHDLHIWSLKHGVTSLSVHLAVDRIGHQEAVLQSAQRVLSLRFGISHTTIQVEPLGDECESECV